MSLSPGVRVGSFEIVAKLGEGGMGEVWRARDPALGRDVALKVLPEAFTEDAERLARFEREAQPVALPDPADSSPKCSWKDPSLEEAPLSNRTRILIALGCAVVAALSPISAQSPPPVALAGTEFHDFVAKDGTHYDLRVALPSKSGFEEGALYPVLYLIDGYFGFGLVTETYRLLRLGEEIEPVLIVGVDRHYGSDLEWLRGREFDLTPSRDAEYEAARAAAGLGTIETGGAPAFARVLTEEIVPWVEGRYPASDVRALAGYSYGGLFAAHVLLTSPEKFSRYLVGSPSLYWQNGAILELEGRRLPELKEIAARVFLSACEFEMGEEPPLSLIDTAADMRRFAFVLSQRKFPGLTLQTKFFEGETHVSGFPATLSRGLRFLFAPEAGAP